MSLTRRKRTALFVGAAALAAVYLAGYAFARGNHWLVHRSGFSQGRTVTNYIATGDLGPGLHPAAEISYVVFAPLRWVEALYWHIHPKGGA